MDWKSGQAWPFDPTRSVQQLPVSAYQIIDLTYWDPDAGDPTPAAGLIVQQNINGIEHFVRSQRQLYSLGIVPVLSNIRQLSSMTVQYINQLGREQIIYIVQPTSSVPVSSGLYVLIQFTANPVLSGDSNKFQSSPTGSSLSYAIDPVNGTECPFTIDIANLMQGAKILYSKIDVTVTPTTSWFAYLEPTATLQITDVDLGTVGSGSTRDAAGELAYLEGLEPLPTITSEDIGYHNTLVFPSGEAFVFTTEAAASAKAASLNGGGPGSVGASGGYTIPTASFGGPYDGHTLTILWVPYTVTSGTFYAATFTATYVLQLPQIVGKMTTPAFSINTTGYGWKATITVVPNTGVKVDPTNPSYPLKWSNASNTPPPGADGGVWQPFGSPDTNIQDNFVWQIFYQDFIGTAKPTSYPFVVTFENHLEDGVPVFPVPPPIPALSPVNFANKITQMYPTFLNPANPFGDPPGDAQWYVLGYSDVPYGTSFNPPFTGPAAAWSGDFSPGPLPLLPTSDVPL